MKKLLLFFFLIFPVCVYSQTTVIINSTGSGDYASLASAIAGRLTIDADLTGDGPLFFEINNAFEETSVIILNGFTTTAADYIYIYTVGAARPSGIGWDTNAHRISYSAASAAAIWIRDNHVRLDGLQARYINPTADEKAPLRIDTITAPNDIYISNCVFMGHNSPTEYQRILINDIDIDLKMWNCIFFNFYPVSTFSSVVYLNVANSILTNNTIIGGYYGIRSIAGTNIVHNNVVFDQSNTSYSQTFTTSENNAYSIGTDPGTSGVDISAATGTLFTNYSISDFTLQAGSPLISAGTSENVLSVTDFVEYTRTAPYDIGAFEAQVDTNIIYVDSVSGDDASVSPYTPETALKTITAMNARAEIGSGSEIRFQGEFRQEKINIDNARNAQNMIFTSYGYGAEIKGSSDITHYGDWIVGDLSNTYYLIASGSTVPSITAPLDLFFNETQRGLRDFPIGNEYAWGYSDTIGGVTKYEDFEAFDVTDYDTKSGTLADAGDGTPEHGEFIYTFDASEKLRKNSVNYKSMRLTYDWYLSSAVTPSEGNRTQLVNFTNTTHWTGSTSLRVTGIYSGGVFYIGLDFGNTYSTTYALAFDTWYRIDFLCDAVTGDAALYVNNGLVESLSGLTTANYVNLWEVGQMNLESANYRSQMDNLYIAEYEWQRLPFETVWVNTHVGDPDTSGVILEAPFVAEDLFGQSFDESGYNISNLTFLHSGSRGFLSVANPGNNVIENCTFNLNLKHGVIITGQDLANLSVNNLIRYVTADLNGETGLSFGQYVQNSTISYCETDRNAQTDADSTAGIRIVPGGGLGTTWWANTDIWGLSNIVSNTGKDATGTYEFGHQTLTNGIWFDTIINATIMFNISYNNMGAGIYPECTSKTVTAWNLSYDNEYGFRADTAKISPMGNEENRITNNTFVNNSIAGILNAGKANDQTFISVSNNYFANNIVYGNPISLWVRYGGQNTQAADGWGSGNEYLNNSLGVETTGFLKILNTTYDTYSAFNTVFDPDLTGITIDPELVNPAAANFILAVTSPVIDQGIDHDWQGSVDLLANSIIIPVDYGAYENQEPTYTPTPTATPTATPTPTVTNTPTATPIITPSGSNPIMNQRIKDRRKNNIKEQ